MTKDWDAPFSDQRNRQRIYDRAIKKIRWENDNCSFKLAQLILKKQKLLERLKTTETELQKEMMKPHRKEQNEKRGRLPW